MSQAGCDADERHSEAPVREAAPEVVELTRDEIVESLFREHYEGLLRLSYCILGDRCSAEDVVMEAFCSLHTHWSTLRDRASPVGYLRVSVLNLSRSRIRALVRERTRTGWADPPPVLDTSVSVIERDEAHRLVEAVRSLPRRQCEVIVCRYFLELSEAETAALLGMSTGSVKRHAHRARAALSTSMEVTR
ncbi:RNA polymerase sigma factor [Ornithinimicrobium sp. W1665]